MSDDTHLFDVEPFTDPDVYAARELVREISGDPTSELAPGYQGANFCPIAVSLALATGIGDLDYNDFKQDPEGYSQAEGGGSYLWQVDSDRVIWPAGNGDHDTDAIDLVSTSGVLSDENYERLELEGYAIDPSGGDLLFHFTEVPDDAWGPGAGTVPSFIQRYDMGEFPSLRLAS